VVVVGVVVVVGGSVDVVTMTVVVGAVVGAGVVWVVGTGVVSLGLLPQETRFIRSTAISATGTLVVAITTL
jgi:hypothetical protein